MRFNLLQRSPQLHHPIHTTFIRYHHFSPSRSMKLSHPTFALAFAASTIAQYDVKSPPFHLIVLSDDDAVNGTTISACHSGAAIESLCLSTGNSPSNPSPIAPATFYFNTSTNTQPASPGSTPGVLGYDLPTGTTPIPSTLDLYVDPTSNYAQPMFYPGYSGQTLAVDAQDLFNIQGYVDYSVNPPKAGDNVAYYRWYVCITYFTGYQYRNVVWGLGDEEPETPGCVKVDLKRVFL